jgi:hypothetical protein
MKRLRKKLGNLEEVVVTVVALLLAALIMRLGFDIAGDVMDMLS